MNLDFGSNSLESIYEIIWVIFPLTVKIV